jgi:hypothetical protein
MQFNKFLATFLVVMASFVFAGSALAGTKQVPMGYCGPSFSSKTAMISWYSSHPAQRARAEVWVRLHASYYHIQPDQSFIAWLSMPNVKFRMAPAGYTLQHNTRCDGVGNVIPYDHKLGVGKLSMLWWCNDAKGSGSGCVPIAKFYCRNFVMGHMVFPKPSVPAKPKKPPVKPTVPGSCNVTNSPGGTACSTITYVNVCGTQVVYNGDQKDIVTWTNQYIADHCQPTVSTNVCSNSAAINYGKPGDCVIVTQAPPPPCNCTPTPPPPVTPPVVVPPTPTMDVKNVTSPEEVNNDGEFYPNLFADAYTPNGDSITCVIGVTNPNDHSQSGFGSISGQRSFTFVSHGFDRVGPYTYQAPTDTTAVGKYDQLEVTCHDNSNVNVKNASGFSQSFQVIATKPSP